MILSDVLAEPSQLGIWVVCLTVVLSLAASIYSMRRQPPLEQQFASKEDVARMERQLEKVEGLINKMGEKLNQDRRDDVARLHDKIEETQNLLRQEVEGKIERVRSEVHDMPNRFVERLRSGRKGREAE